tara:strand:- start:25 stop:207 length:183 start_codon:yes stop_codon:yes gene_type:complete
MARYKLRTHPRVDADGTSLPSIEDILDQELNRSIPKDPANGCYQEYLEWIAEGNTADPAD